MAPIPTGLIHYLTTAVLHGPGWNLAQLLHNCSKKGVVMRAIAAVMGLMLLVSTARADVLIFASNKRAQGKLSYIGESHIEFIFDTRDGKGEWKKVDKKDILVILDDHKKMIYPRDKYDEMALNYGKVKLRTAADVQRYKDRKMENLSTQQMNEQKEKNRFKVAVVIGGLGGIMAWAFLQGN
jgi:hypothetical protein